MRSFLPTRAKIPALMIVSAMLSGCSSGEQIAVSLLNKQDLTQYEIRGDRMFLSGELNARTPKKIKTALLANTQIKTIVLTKMPGSLDDDSLYPFASWIRAKGYNTHLEKSSEISSGAVDLFLAGVERTMEMGARLGVHAWSDGANEATDYARIHLEHTKYVDYTTSMLGSDAFYWFTIEAAPADGLHWMTLAEIERFGILTGPVQN